MLAAIGLASVVFNACKKDEPNKTIEVANIAMESTLSLVAGEYGTLTATITPGNATDTTITWTSSNEAIATVDPTGKVTAVAAGIATITAKAGEKTVTCEVTVTPDPKTSDVGVVINGVTWATRNVDAPGTFAEKPESAGMYYQWNRKTAWATTGNVSGWNTTYPTGVTWEKANDPSPAGWRVPTKEEQETLFDTKKVTNVWTTQNGIKGQKFTDKATGNSLFLPAVGYRLLTDGTLFDVGNASVYNSSTSFEYIELYAAYALFFFKDYAGVVYDSRCYGVSIRPVLAE